MRIFCSFAFTGEDLNSLTSRMERVVNILTEQGNDVYCPLFDPIKIGLQEKEDTRGIFRYAFENISKSDAMVAIVSSERKSEGQLMEIGVILSQSKPLYLFQHKSVQVSHLPKLATKTFIWKDQNELEDNLKRI